MLFKIFGCLSFLLTLSCSTTEITQQQREKSLNLETGFKLSREEFQKFLETDNTPAPPPASSASLGKKGKKNKKGGKLMTTVKVPSESRPGPADQSSQPPAATAPSGAVPLDISSEIGPEIGRSHYPADYPPQFIEYDRISLPVWQKFQAIAIPGEEMRLKLKYLGVTCGEVTLSVLASTNLGKVPVHHLRAHLKSADYYNYIYTLDDTIDSYVQIHTFRPIKYKLVQRETSQDIDDLQLFDHEELKTMYWFKRLKRGQVKEENIQAYTPEYMQDSFSALFFLRGLPLKKGDQYQFPVITRTKVWLAKIEVKGNTVIEVNGVKEKAIELKIETQYPGVLEKKGDIQFWFSQDAQRRVLKFNAKVKIGYIEGELLSYKSP